MVVLAVNDNQVIWPAYNFFQQFFYWPSIMIYLILELLWNEHTLYEFLFTFLNIEGPVIYNFLILVLGLIFDRGGTPLVDFFISQYDFGLGCERDFCSFSAPFPLHQGELFIQYISLCNLYMYMYVLVCIGQNIHILHAFTSRELCQEKKMWQTPPSSSKYNPFMQQIFTFHLILSSFIWYN